MPVKAISSRPNNQPSRTRSAVSNNSRPQPSPAPSVGKPQGTSGSTTNTDRQSSTRNVRDSASVSREAQKPEQDNNIGGLLSGLSEWGGDNRQDSQSPVSDAERPETPKGDTPQVNAAEQSASEGLSLESGQFLGTQHDSSPEQVTQLQELLNTQSGGQLQVDGRYGPRTEEAVRSFQEQNGLTVDGVVGPETLAALNRPRGSEETSPSAPAEQTSPAVPGERGQVSLADPNLSPAEQYEHYRQLIEANGGQINPDGATVLGLRGLGTDGERHDGRSNIGGYDDSFIVLNQGENGTPSVQLFRGATHANQRTSSYSSGPDNQGNTIQGVAMIAPGNFVAVPHSNDYRGRGPSYHVRTLGGSGDLPAYRDRNRDGAISSQERSQAEAGGYTADQILFHGGRDDAPSSIGCQTLTPSDMRAFSRAIGGGGFNYTLLDANDSFLPA